MSMVQHVPVLVNETLEGLRCQQGGVFLDCTVGCGGHAAAILSQHPENRLIGIDRDAEALHIAQTRLAPFGDRACLVHTRFEHIEQILQGRVEYAPRSGFGTPCGFLDENSEFDGILMDLGVSSLQLDQGERGFSFLSPARLDMRMNQQDSRTAYDVVNAYSADDLANVIFHYGEERQSRRIAKWIVNARASKPVETTTELAAIVKRAIPKRFQPKAIHPATKTFQAIRIEVNDELPRLGATIEQGVGHLRTWGRICIISFHSLEDRIVKRTFLSLEKGCQCPPDFPECVCGKHAVLQRITKKPITASAGERKHNPRSRSAKLRIAEKT